VKDKESPGQAQYWVLAGESEEVVGPKEKSLAPRLALLHQSCLATICGAVLRNPGGTNFGG